MSIIVTHRPSIYANYLQLHLYIIRTLISYYPYSYFILYRQCEFLILILVSDTITVITIVSTFMEVEIILYF